MKILYVTTISGTMGFFKEEFRHLQENGNTIDLACSYDENYKLNFDTSKMRIYNIPFSRSPYSRDNILAYKKLKSIIEDSQYDIVHCHTPIAAAITRLCCKKYRKKGTKVIYTAHGFHFFKGAPFINWLIYFPIEWICSFWTDCLITINSEDYSIAKKFFHAKRIKYVPGVGIDISKFSTVTVDKKDKCSELGILNNKKILLSVGELNDNKNHETVIRAISGMDVFYLIAGIGDKLDHLKDVAKEVGMEDRVKFLGFRNDIPELLAISDVFVFPSFREGLSVSLMEAMSSGKPAIVSKIRGNSDLIDHHGGILIDPYSIKDVRKAIKKIFLRNFNAMGDYNKIKVKKFNLSNVLRKIDSIYCK